MIFYDKIYAIYYTNKFTVDKKLDILQYIYNYIMMYVVLNIHFNLKNKFVKWQK